MHDLLGRLYTDAEWEALCNRCGQCCYESRWTGSGWEETGVPCGHLDEESLLCTAYGDRFAVEQDCIRVDASVVLRGMLPVECSYLEELARIIDEDFGGADPQIEPVPRRDRSRRARPTDRGRRARRRSRTMRDEEHS